MKLREFQDVDYYGFAGVEWPDENTPPLIGEMMIPDWPEEDDGQEILEVMVIVDKNGIGIHGMDGAFCLVTTFALAKEIAEKILFDGIHLDKIIDLGFEPFNFPEEVMDRLELNLDPLEY